MEEKPGINFSTDGPTDNDEKMILSGSIQLYYFNDKQYLFNMFLIGKSDEKEGTKREYIMCTFYTGDEKISLVIYDSFFMYKDIMKLYDSWMSGKENLVTRAIEGHNTYMKCFEALQHVLQSPLYQKDFNFLKLFEIIFNGGTHEGRKIQSAAIKDLLDYGIEKN